MDNFDRLYTVAIFKELRYDTLKDFNDIVKLAAEICDAPIALITLLDEENNNFIAKVGVDMDRSPANISFCQYTIQQDDAMVVNDTLLDERFVDNPTVAAGIRFYAGSALQANNGCKIGSLCVMDVKPKTLTPLQERTLELLSRHATNLMEMQLSHKILMDNQADLERQNHTLNNIAHVHSHEFRRPIASLLGLMNIIVEEDYHASKEYLQLMQEAVKEMDEKIHKVVEYTRVI